MIHRATSLCLSALLWYLNWMRWTCFIWIKLGLRLAKALAWIADIYTTKQISRKKYVHEHAFSGWNAWRVTWKQEEYCFEEHITLHDSVPDRSITWKDKYLPSWNLKEDGWLRWSRENKTKEEWIGECWAISCNEVKFTTFFFLLLHCDSRCYKVPSPGTLCFSPPLRTFFAAVSRLRTRIAFQCRRLPIINPSIVRGLAHNFLENRKGRREGEREITVRAKELSAARRDWNLPHKQTDFSLESERQIEGRSRDRVESSRVESGEGLCNLLTTF